MATSEAAGSGSDKFSFGLTAGGSGTAAKVSVEAEFGAETGVAGDVGAAGVSAAAIAGLDVIGVSIGAGALTFGISGAGDSTRAAVAESVETSLGFSRSFGTAGSAMLASEGAASGAGVGGAGGGGDGGVSEFDGARGFRRKGGGCSSLMASGKQVPPIHETKKIHSRSKPRFTSVHDSIMKLKQLVFLVCVSALTVPAVTGCHLFRKSKKPKDPAIAADVEADFRQRWVDHRTAELVAQKVDPTVARQQAETEFHERFTYLKEGKK